MLQRNNNPLASAQNPHRPILAGSQMIYLGGMRLRCLFLRHRPMLTSIVEREGGFAALCDDCGAPIERRADGPWTRAQGLLSRRDQAASELGHQIRAGLQPDP
jgi:hypothetical protein